MQKNGKGYVLLCVVIALSIISAVYWSMYVVNNYNTFHEYVALDYYSYSMYYDVAYPNAMGGLQLLVSGVHLAPDQLLVLLFFYFVQSPLTPLIIQAVVLSFTAVIIFFIGRDILKSNSWGLILSVVYLINPGMHGLLLIDYHAEMFIIPFYLLTFYYYMRLNKKMFYLSTLLLLGTLDVAVILTFAFGIGLYVYEIVDKGKGWPNRIGLARNMIALAVVALIAYNLVYYYLTACYTASCSSVPQLLRLVPWPGVPLFSSNIIYRGISYSNFFQTFVQSIYNGQFVSSVFSTIVLYGVVVAFISFGLAALTELPYLIISLAPWLLTVFVLQFQDFASISRQYFAYVIGATVVATALGLMKLASKIQSTPAVRREMLRAFLVSSTLVTALLIFVMSLFAYIPGTDWGPLQIYAFQTTASQQQSYAQLNYIISLVPANASLMTQETIFPHVMDRQNIELLEYQPRSFVPQYILVDTSPDFFPQYLGNVSNYLHAYTTNYTLYAENGTAMLYKAKG